jgi:ADP-ribose pyrophosphatase
MKASKEVQVKCVTPFVTFVERDYEHNGHKGTWAYATRRKVKADGSLGKDSKAVVIIAKTEDGEYILNKEFRVPMAGESGEDGYNISFPAGIKDDGEAPEQAAIRELSEETPYRVKGILDVSPPLASSPGITDEMIYLVRCIVEPDPNGHDREPSEDIETFLARDIHDSRIPQNIKWGFKCWMELYHSTL